MRYLDNGDPVVCETTEDGIPLCKGYSIRVEEKRIPLPDEFVEGKEIHPAFEGRELPLPITCPECLELIHA